MQHLLNAPERLNLILSNTGTDDATDKAARQALHEKIDPMRPGVVIDWMLASDHIGHNKFLVASDANGNRVRVATGSTHTRRAQTNNLLILDSAELAAAYARLLGAFEK